MRDDAAMVRSGPVALACVLALLMSACGGASSGPAEPGAALTEAVESAVGSSFAFSARIEMDQAARRTVAETEPRLASTLTDLAVRGRRTQRGFSVEVLSSGAPLAEWRQPEPDRLYLRVDAAAAAEVAGVALDQAHIIEQISRTSASASEFYRGALDGGWVGVTGPPAEYATPGARMPDLESGTVRAASREHLGDSPSEWLRRFTTTTEGPGGEGRRLEVAVRARALSEALIDVQRAIFTEMIGEERAEMAPDLGADVAAVPAAVSGVTVDLRDRRVRRVTLEVFEIVRQLATGDEGPEGSLSLVVELSEHGSASVEAPDGAAMFDATDLGVAHPRRFVPYGSAMPWEMLLFMVPSLAGNMVVESETHVGTATARPETVRPERATPTVVPEEPS